MCPSVVINDAGWKQKWAMVLFPEDAAKEATGYPWRCQMEPVPFVAACRKAAERSLRRVSERRPGQGKGGTRIITQFPFIGEISFI